MFAAKVYVPREIGICVDDFGFLGVLDLSAPRGRYNPHEFLGLVKDRRSDAYLADFHHNENPDGETFVLKRVESIHRAGLYYVSDEGSFDNIGSLESYVLCLTECDYCFLRRRAGERLPEVGIGSRKWGGHYEVVRDVK